MNCQESTSWCVRIQDFTDKLALLLLDRSLSRLHGLNAGCKEMMALRTIRLEFSFIPTAGFMMIPFQASELNFSREL